MSAAIGAASGLDKAYSYYFFLLGNHNSHFLSKHALIKQMWWQGSVRWQSLCMWWEKFGLEIQSLCFTVGPYPAEAYPGVWRMDFGWSTRKWTKLLSVFLSLIFGLSTRSSWVFSTPEQLKVDAKKVKVLPGWKRGAVSSLCHLHLYYCLLVIL